jgi:hypothetical protein
LASTILTCQENSSSAVNVPINGKHARAFRTLAEVLSRMVGVFSGDM